MINELNEFVSNLTNEEIVYLLYQKHILPLCKHEIYNFNQ